MNVLIKITFLFLCLFLSSSLYSQENNTSTTAPKSKQQKRYEKKKQKQIQNAKKVEEELKEIHWKHQTKAVQKRMKKSRKKADKLNRRKAQTSPWKQWWYRKTRK